MKKTFLLLFVLFFSTTMLAGDETTNDDPIVLKSLQQEDHHWMVSQIISKLLLQRHYKKVAINDSLSSEIFDRYIEKLDYSKLYFLKSDIESFESHRDMFDNFVNSGQLQEAYQIFNVYLQRFEQRMNFVYKRLEEPFDFTVEESLDRDREKAPWATSAQELDEQWRMRLKDAALDLKLAGKPDNEIATTLRKRYRRVHRDLSKSQSEDVFQLVMNALTESFDPHTTYFSPKNFDDFKIRMSQSLEGIGARLVSENEYTKIVDIVAGGPAEKSRRLHPNDRIVAVGQGSSGEMVDVIGWRIDDVVQLIRGKKNTTVRLAILPEKALAGAIPDTVAIRRDRIKLEDQSAKSELLEMELNGRQFTYGVINIPVFYSDFEAMRRGERDYKSTTRDVRRFLEEFKARGVDGVIIDLRRNGGGFLNEAVDLTGLFIDKGPVVQVRSNTRRPPAIERDTDPDVVYDGPLAVIIDRLSASASEIFAAAIQDYKRGLIIGSRSFGKGTVQHPIDLNSYYRDKGLLLGQIKLTRAKFYRIDGRSTQHVGVTPDVPFPSRLELMDIGESSRENALIYDAIDPVMFNATNEISQDILPALVAEQRMRLASNEDYARLMDQIGEYERARDKTSVSLNESTRRAENKKNKEKAQAEEDATEDDGENGESDKKRRKKDILLNESASVLSDYIILQEKKKTP